MNLWVIFLLVAVVAMVLGPIMMLQPHAGQRAQEHLRRRAMELGLRVRIMSLPRQATDTETPAATAVYCLPDQQSEDAISRAEWLLLRTAYVHAAHFMDDWQWHGAGRTSAEEEAVLRQIVPSLPLSVSAVGGGPQGVCFYWSERGGEDVLNRLLPLLQRLRDVRT
jgi:hypothetical protein